MREILFRGKVKSALNVDKWVYGFLVNARSRFNGELRTYIQTIKENGELDFLVAVDPQTVGQYTGLTDKNGTKIFEGDVLAFSDRLVYVTWHERSGSWDCKYLKSIDGEKTMTRHRKPDMWKIFSEVIGNIHDNPELVKGGESDA